MKNQRKCRTDCWVDCRLVKDLDESLLRLQGDGVHFEVATDEELTSHCDDVD